MMLKLHTRVHKPWQRLWHYLPFSQHSVITKVWPVTLWNLCKCWYLMSGRCVTVPRAGTGTGAVPGDTEGSPKEILKAICRRHYKPGTHTGCFRCQRAEGTTFPLQLCCRQHGQAMAHNSQWSCNSQWPHTNIWEPLLVSHPLSKVIKTQIRI